MGRQTTVLYFRNFKARNLCSKASAYYMLRKPSDRCALASSTLHMFARYVRHSSPILDILGTPEESERARSCSLKIEVFAPMFFPLTKMIS